ncbi:hypothetical protein SHKM778_41700 [Streptomyces sp. KM77-8]|uniref:Heme chaperone HemW n=1 Tax=Streptomyces haneummycinicus TaxID=3074435 RepID=A0AAT9HJR2_9ACTN
MTTARTTRTTAPASPYQSYVYAYPHKTAYRRLADRPRLGTLWAGEPKDALSLYLHIPFCEVRCGFCNLFTRIGAPDGLTGAYLDALERQATAVREALGSANPPVRHRGLRRRHPTFLTAAELERLCDIAEHRMGAGLRAVPLSVEASPATATADRLEVLAARGTTRLSLGVQSFDDAEARAAVRPQRRADVEAALGRVRDTRIPVLNIDLIYGIDGQTEHTWLRSLDAALAWHPEELYLYPSTYAPSPDSAAAPATRTRPGTHSGCACTGWAATTSSPAATPSSPCACSAAPTPRRRARTTTPARPTA